MKLRVVLHGTTVGFLQASGDRAAFRFHPAYLRMADRPVLSRSYEDVLAPDFVDKSTQLSLPSFFQNYLPEPNSALRELLARRAGVSASREAQLLAALGDDLPGAVVVYPVEEDADEDEIATNAAESTPATDASPSGPLRFSLAGMQLKFSVARADQRITIPASGVGGRFILKLPDRAFPLVPVNEFSMMTWAKHGGLTVPDVHLVPWSTVENLPAELTFDESNALLVERFDRPSTGGGRIHQEDFAQVLRKRPTEKYGRDGGGTFDRIGKVIRAVCGEADFEEFLRRLVFVVLSSNPDAHLKNWSLWYPDRRVPRLAPAYDLVSTCAYHRISTELACKLGGEWALPDVRTWHFGILASHAGMSAERGVEIAQEAAQKLRDSWRSLEKDLPLDAEQRNALNAHLGRIKLP